MLFLKLFLIFTKIGTFNFGGGYAMLSLIHNETVVKNHWLTNAEFTDIVAISQSTPGTYRHQLCHLRRLYRLPSRRLSYLGSLSGFGIGFALHHVAAFHHHDSHQPLSDYAQRF